MLIHQWQPYKSHHRSCAEKFYRTDATSASSDVFSGTHLVIATMVTQQKEVVQPYAALEDVCLMAISLIPILLTGAKKYALKEIIF